MPETNDNENMTTQNLGDPIKAVLRGNFIAIQSTSRNKRNIKHLKQLEKEQTTQKLVEGKKP